MIGCSSNFAIDMSGPSYLIQLVSPVIMNVTLNSGIVSNASGVEGNCVLPVL